MIDGSIYFAEPTDINPEPLTHILYAFADVSPDTGNITLTDSYADEQVCLCLRMYCYSSADTDSQKHFPGDSWDDTGNNLYGCLKQMFLLKMAHRNLKVSLSVGGYTYSQDGHFSFVTDATKRQTFVESALQLIEDYGFDGLDLDFEYPSSAEQGQGFADLITSLRSAFDTYQAQKGDATPYVLTVCQFIVSFPCSKS